PDGRRETLVLPEGYLHNVAFKGQPGYQPPAVKPDAETDAARPPAAITQAVNESTVFGSMVGVTGSGNLQQVKLPRPDVTTGPSRADVRSAMRQATEIFDRIGTGDVEIGTVDTGGLRFDGPGPGPSVLGVGQDSLDGKTVLELLDEVKGYGELTFGQVKIPGVVNMLDESKPAADGPFTLGDLRFADQQVQESFFKLSTDDQQRLFSAVRFDQGGTVDMSTLRLVDPSASASARDLVVGISRQKPGTVHWLIDALSQLGGLGDSHFHRFATASPSAVIAAQQSEQVTISPQKFDLRMDGLANLPNGFKGLQKLADASSNPQFSAAVLELSTTLKRHFPDELPFLDGNLNVADPQSREVLLEQAVDAKVDQALETVLDSQSKLREGELGRPLTLNELASLAKDIREADGPRLTAQIRTTLEPAYRELFDRLETVDRTFRIMPPDEGVDPARLGELGPRFFKRYNENRVIYQEFDGNLAALPATRRSSDALGGDGIIGAARQKYSDGAVTALIEYGANRPLGARNQNVVLGLNKTDNNTVTINKAAATMKRFYTDPSLGALAGFDSAGIEKPLKGGMSSPPLSLESIGP
ncbi:MAG: hypothetical protein AAFX50_13025, partial [Acidobacteriota bacterium]